MQNKPNLLDAQMNVSSALTKYYENKPRLPAPGKQTQSNPILPAHLNIKLALNFTGRGFLKFVYSYFKMMRGHLFEAGQLSALLLTFVDILPDEVFKNLRLFY